jgi:biotin transport system substrate-specific component
MTILEERLFMMNMDRSLKMMAFSALMASFIAAGAYLAIPIGPVPIVLQNLFVLLAGLLLGGRWAAISVGTYLLAGICGLPIFAGGGAGLARLFGPTGGYLLGFLPAAFFVGIIVERAQGRLLVEVAAMVGASIIIYACGVPRLMMVTQMPFEKALMVGVYPFIIGDALKIAAAIGVARSVRPLISNAISRSLSNSVG